LNPTFSISHISIKATGTSIAGACDRQKKILGFDQEKFCQSHVLCIGAGGLISNVAPALVRKGIGALTVLDHDDVEVTNLNRQRFYSRDIGQNKAVALVRNLQSECVHNTNLAGFATDLESAISDGLDVRCDVAVCGVDNNPTRVVASRFFRQRRIPVIFTAVSADADHGYIFIQRPEGPCIGCVFPDIVNDETHPCPGTPAVSDILQVMGAFVTYAIDAVLMDRKRDWNYRAVYLSTGNYDCCTNIEKMRSCPLKMEH
jgi:molybdopterin-synthase adenylyltransferase